MIRSISHWRRLPGLLAVFAILFAGMSGITPPASAAGSIGLINSVGNLGGFIGPKVMGWLAPRTRGRADGRRVSELVAQRLAAADLAAHDRPPTGKA